MLAIGFVTGWLVGRPTTMPPERGAIAQDSSNQAEVQSNTTENVDLQTNVEPVEIAPTDAVEVAQIEPIAESNAPILPTPTFIEPEERLVLGDPNAPVKIVEFSDYECPFCARYSQSTFLRLKQNFIDTGRVYYEFKDFPLTSIHPTARNV